MEGKSNIGRARHFASLILTILLLLGADGVFAQGAAKQKMNALAVILPYKVQGVWVFDDRALAIPGLGPFIAAGPIMAALSGGAIGAGVGGLAGALVGLGIPEYEAKRYEGKVKEGGILISVHSENNDETNRAKGIFKEAGAHDISSTGEAHSDVKAQDVSETGDVRVREVSRRNDITENDTPSSRDSTLRETERDF